MPAHRSAVAGGPSAHGREFGKAFESMASTPHTKLHSRKRILANIQERKKGGIAEPPPKQETTAAARTDDAERILSQAVKAGKKRRKPVRSRSVTQVSLLGAIVIVGIAAIIGLRYLGEAFGVNWIGD